jgi:hypothetical protein
MADKFFAQEWLAPAGTCHFSGSRHIRGVIDAALAREIREKERLASSSYGHMSQWGWNMIKIVELMPEDEFADIGIVKADYLHGIKEYLSGMGYAVTHVDRSEWYSFERKILVDTNAPTGIIDSVVREQNRRQKRATGFLVA